MMKKALFLFVLVCLGCTSDLDPKSITPEFVTLSQGSSGDMGGDADMGSSPEQDFAAACSTPEAGRWMKVIEVTQDMTFTAPVKCTVPVIINGNGYTIHDHGIHFKAGASWSTLENLKFVGQDVYLGVEAEPVPHASGNSVGIFIEAHGVRMKNIMVQYFDEGVSIWGTATNATNTNTNVINQALLWNNGIGLLIDGGDSQAGRFSDISTRNNTVHIWDSSFLGNIHIGGVQDGNGVYRRHDSAAAYSLLLGVYVEGDPILPNKQAVDMIGYNTVVGGALSAWTSSSSYVGQAQATVNPVSSKLGFGTKDTPVRMSIPGPNSAFTYSHETEDHWAWHAFRFFDHTKTWALTAYLNSGYHYPMYWYGKYTAPGAYIGQPVIWDWDNSRIIPSSDIETVP